MRQWEFRGREIPGHEGGRTSSMSGLQIHKHADSTRAFVRIRHA